MSHRIEVKQSARKALASLPASTRQRIASAIDALSADPRPTGCRKLVGSESLYRIRVGEFRVLFEVHDDRLAIVVIKIAHRREAYR
jgi:mRNA interferase RelE/StbE